MIISVIISNHLHDARILDPTDPAQQIGQFVVESLIDGDIPMRIEVEKDCQAPRGSGGTPGRTNQVGGLGNNLGGPA